MARFCRYCGAQMSDNARFCRGCGRTVDTPQTNNVQTVNNTPVQQTGAVPAQSVCPNCGNAIRPGARFCRTCGVAAGITMPVMVPGNIKDKTLPVKVTLGIVCAALFIVGVITIPGNIKAARAGADVGLFSSSDTPAFDYDEFGTLTEQQMDEYAYIDETVTDDGLNDDIPDTVYTHEKYTWLDEEDGLDEADRE